MDNIQVTTNYQRYNTLILCHTNGQETTTHKLIKGQTPTILINTLLIRKNKNHLYTCVKTTFIWTLMSMTQ